MKCILMKKLKKNLIPMICASLSRQILRIQDFLSRWKNVRKCRIQDGTTLSSAIMKLIFLLSDYHKFIEIQFRSKNSTFEILDIGEISTSGPTVHNHHYHNLNTQFPPPPSQIYVPCLC